MDQKRANARTFLGYFEDDSIDRLDEILTSECVIHGTGSFELPHGPEAARALNAALSKFTKSHWHFEDEFGTADRLVVRTINETVQHGVWNGLAGNGRTVSFPVVWIFRFEADKIAEVWRTADDLSRVRQLGGKIVPA